MGLDIQPDSCPLGRELIKTILPHREPILLVDRVLTFNEARITTEIELGQHPELFQGHFPDRAILPGIYMIEMAAQAGALLVSLSLGIDDNKFIAFSGVDKVKFRRPVKPGDIIRVDVEIVKVRGPFYKFAGKVFVGEEVTTSLEFSASQMSFKN